MKTPTPKQAERLRVLAGGYAVLQPKRREWVGLLRSGWVERIDDSTPRGGLLPPLRITAAGISALALTKPEEGECSETTSAVPSLSAVASGGRLPSLRSVRSTNRLPRHAWTRPRCSSGSGLARLMRPRTSPLWPVPVADAVDNHLNEEWAKLDASASRDRGGYNAGWRCWSCRLFVGGPTATCGHCGQRHGGVDHEAYASR